MSKARIIFVGFHNKPDMKPLDILTKSGKLINRVIKALPKDVEIIKSNLYDVDHFPNESQRPDLAENWYWTHLPVTDDVIILLGAVTHEGFYHKCKNVIKVAHPASKWSHKDMDEYVIKTSEKIIKKLEQ